MKWYHFALLFFVFFCGLIIIEQQEELAEKLWERGQTVEYDCLVAAVNAATEIYFEQKDSKEERVLLEETEEAFFQTLSFLQDKNTDVTGMMQQREHCILLAILDTDGCYFYNRQEDGFCRWTGKIMYDENGKIPSAFFEEVKRILNEYKDAGAFETPDYMAGSALPGIWEKGLSEECVFAVYSSKSTDHFNDRRKGVLYAAAKKVTEEYPVTEDLRCHMSSCHKLKQQDVVAVFKSQKQAANYGAIPCEACLAWEVTE